MLAARLEIKNMHRLTLELIAGLASKIKEEEQEGEEDEFLSEVNNSLESDYVEEHTIAKVEHIGLLERCPDDIDLINEMDTDCITEISNIDNGEVDEEKEPEDNFKMKQGGSCSNYLSTE